MFVDLTEIVSAGENVAVEFEEKFADTIGKTICAFSNTDGGKIYVGIVDQKTNKKAMDRVVGITRAEAEDALEKTENMARSCDPAISVSSDKIDLNGTGRCVLMIDVNESEHKPHEYKGGFYKRVDSRSVRMTRAEVLEIKDSYFDNKICPDFNYKKDFDIEKFHSFLEASDFRGSKNNPMQLLENFGVARKHNGRVSFRNAGVLFFAKDLARFYHHAAIRCSRFRGTDKGRLSSTKTFNRDLLSSIEGAMIFLHDHLKLEYRFSPQSMQREEVLEIPHLALREALINAVTHRDYQHQGANVAVEIFDDRVEISSYGGYPKGLHEKNFGSASRRRNPLIAKLMQRAKYVEEAGTGIPRMRDLTEETGMPVDFDIEASSWKVIFPRHVSYKKLVSSQTFNFGDKSMLPKKIMRLSRILSGIKNDSFSKSSFAESEGIGTRTVEDDLKRLRNVGLIVFEGAPKIGRYRVTREYLQADETGYSPSALKVAKFFISNAKKGDGSDPAIKLPKLAKATALTQEELLSAISELQEATLVKLQNQSAQSTAVLFAELDHLWMPWQPSEDAAIIASDVAKIENFQPNHEQIATRYDWKIRRINPAIYHLKAQAQHSSDTQIHSHKFVQPEEFRFSWERGKSAAHDFLRYALGGANKESRYEEVVIIRCLISLITCMSHELFISIQQEASTTKGIYLASNPAQMRRIDFFKYLQKLEKDLEKKMAEYET